MLELLSDQIKGNINVLLIPETKSDDSFSVGNFLMDGFSSPYRVDRDTMGKGILLYVREDIPLNLLSIKTKPIDNFHVELNPRNDKWLISCSYNSYKNMIGNHLRALSENLDLHSSIYDKFIILGYFNVEMGDPQINSFCDGYSL